MDEKAKYVQFQKALEAALSVSLYYKAAPRYTQAIIGPVNESTIWTMHDSVQWAGLLCTDEIFFLFFFFPLKKTKKD